MTSDAEEREKDSIHKEWMCIIYSIFSYWHEFHSGCMNYRCSSNISTTPMKACLIYLLKIRRDQVTKWKINQEIRIIRTENLFLKSYSIKWQRIEDHLFYVRTGEPEMYLGFTNWLPATKLHLHSLNIHRTSHFLQSKDHNQTGNLGHTV